MTELVGERPDSANIHSRVVEVIATRTLYDEAYLQPDSEFESDLGVDSVVLESIHADLAEQFGLTELPAGAVTIRELVGVVSRALGTADVPVAAGPPSGTPAKGGSAGGAGESGDVMAAVIEAAVAKTGYQRHELDPDAEFESELGIDSVILASIVTEASQRCGMQESDAAGFDATTLRSLTAQLEARAGGNASKPAPPGPAEAAPAGPGEWDGRSMKNFVEQRDPDIFAKTRSFVGYLRRREEEQLYWYGMPLHSRCGNRAVIFDELEGRKREFLMFASNNYLGLANHPAVIDAVCDATRTFGATHTGSRFIGGTNMLHKELERRLAAYKQRPACIVYPGGYAANLGAISALVKGCDTLVTDKLNHMSIVDGARLSGGSQRIYRHNDMADLERILQRSAENSRGGTLIVADGVFSMHGDVCDLPEIVRLAGEYGARVMIDDAHATGVLGARGSGTAEHFGLKGAVDLELGTMSKALAGMGGFVVGEEDVVEYLRYYSHSYVFAANIPAGVAAGLIASIDVIEAEPERLKQLWTNIETLRGSLLEAGFDLENSQSAILPIVIGDERKAMEMGRAVRARGLFCQTVVYPGVPLGDARLRVSVTCEHTPEDLAEAGQIFVDAARETGVLETAR
ncbi:hypothetical protein N566_16945 [Streptomycetaceae bacterium MP113-05]|nr:hypothetical protein N566_16945 [Streptomycetaceae bacterium MP113-05]